MGGPCRGQVRVEVSGTRPALECAACARLEGGQIAADHGRAISLRSPWDRNTVPGRSEPALPPFLSPVPYPVLVRSLLCTRRGVGPPAPSGARAAPKTPAAVRVVCVCVCVCCVYPRAVVKARLKKQLAEKSYQG